MIRRFANWKSPARSERQGSVFVEYVLLVTIVGIGVIVGLACVRESLVNELVELANAINAITP
jgi:pilus assembly protein Flp/PilA